MHYIKKLTPSDYLRVIDLLSEKCNMFYLVESDVVPGAAQYDSDLLQDLAEFLTKTERVSSWAGTEIMVDNEEELAIKYVYSLSDGCAKKLAKYGSFFSYEMDCAFYNNGQCVLYARPSDRVIVVDVEQLEEIFSIPSIVTRKIENFMMIE